MALSKIIKENLALVTGIVLPVGMVIVFMIAAAASRATLPPLTQDFLVHTTAYRANTAQKMDISLDLATSPPRLKAEKPEQPNASRMVPELYRYIAAENRVEKLALPDIQTAGSYDIPALENIRINTSETGKDGYKFTGREYRYGGGLFLDMFSYGNRSDRGWTLTAQDGRSMTIATQGVPYHYDPVFIGWIEE